MTEAEIYAGLTGIFCDTFGDDSILLTPETQASDIPGFDSLKMVSILVGVRDRFGVKFRSREVDGIGSVGDLAKLIAAKSTAP